MATPRRFEYTAGTSSKFWETRVAGRKVLVRHGRIGSDGRASEREFASAREAATHAEAAIREKLAKGYREVGAKPAKAATKSKTAAKAATKKSARTTAKAAVKTTTKAATKTNAKAAVKATTKAAKKTTTKAATKTTTKAAAKTTTRAAAKTTTKAGNKITAKAGNKATTALLARLEAALRRRHPAIAAKLRPGAPSALARLRKLGGDALPESFYAFVQWHGGAGGTPWVDGLVGPDADGIVSLKKMMDGIVDAGHYAAFAADEWWSTGWFPFADDQSGYRSLVVDMHGSFGGRPGQVLSAGAKDSTRTIVAPNFDAWLEVLVEAIEGGHVEAEDDGLQLTTRGRRLFARHRGHPRSCEPRPADIAGEGAGADLTRPTRGRWPVGVPEQARWLVSARGARVAHWFIVQSGATVTTWVGDQPTALRKTSKRSPARAGALVDEALRKQLAAGFVYARPGSKRGQPLCVLHVGDGSNAEHIDLSPDGRTLVVGTISAQAKGARLHLIDIETGRRVVLHEEQPGHGQTFLHRIAFGRDGRSVYYQLNTRLCELSVGGGAPKLLADMDEPPFNPFVTRFEFDRARERLLYFQKSTIRVRGPAGKDLLKIATRQGPCEYREATISPSGKLIALVYVSRGVLYGHEDAAHDKTSEIQIWSVDRAKLLYTLPHRSEMLRRISISPDDDQLVVGDYSEIVARDLRTGKRMWRREAREWAYSPDGTKLAVVDRGINVSLLAAATRRPLFTVDERHPWATSHAEIHSPETLGFSRDGSLLYMGNGGGRVYVWQAK